MLTKTVEATARRSLTDGTADAPTVVCFVCTGNTCRSPMAAAVTNALEAERRSALPKDLQSRLPRPVLAISRGLYADGSPLSQGALHALLEAGVTPVEGENDYRTHVSQTMTAEDAERCDLLCAMTRGHAMELLLRFPQCAGKILVMPTEIPDPYGGDADAYRACLAAIGDGVRALFFADGKEASEP